MTLEMLYEAFDQMNDFTAEFYNHDIEPVAYYDALTDVFNNMGIKALVNDQTIEYLKSMQSPIIAVDGQIISMGRIPEDFELLDAIDDGEKVTVGAPKGF